ncbi:HAMP domain-containing protein [candidate division KSB1 bacterium]|nr:HAMP domain-containing protein [candidate division KSB1 bacterium]
MKILSGPSIKQKLTSIIIITSCIALFFACLAFIIFDRVTFQKRLEANIDTITQIAAENSNASLLFNNKLDAIRVLESLKAEKSIEIACIYDSSKTIFATLPVSIDTTIVPKAVELKPLREYKHGYMIVQKLVYDQDKSAVLGLVYVKASMAIMNSRLKQIIYISSLFLLISIFIVSAISLQLQNIITTPILHLASVARDVSLQKDYSVRARKFSGDELGFLTDRFNEMLIQIQEREYALQNAYDELKTKTDELETELNVRRVAEQQLKNSLSEKEVLLREIHHRVKNNLQVISSLIYLQTKNITDIDALRMFRDGQNRVKSMALIHEELYNSKDLSSIDFGAYIKNLSSHLFHSYREESKTIILKSDVDDISLNIDTAINCGMIINELVSNSLKHAFHNMTRGTIHIGLHATNTHKFLMTIGDDGSGFPRHINFRNTTSLGLQLVCNLIDQLNGTIELTNNQGTEFKIVFAES